MMPEKKENQTKKRKKNLRHHYSITVWDVKLLNANTHTKHTIHTKREIFGNKSLLNGND